MKVAEAASGEMNGLMLRDNLSGCLLIYGCCGASAEHVAKTNIDWSAALEVPSQLMSYGPVSSKNVLLRLAAKDVRSTHHFTFPYSP